VPNQNKPSGTGFALANGMPNDPQKSAQKIFSSPLASADRYDTIRGYDDDDGNHYLGVS
jgi:hypothetical protein